MGTSPSEGLCVWGRKAEGVRPCLPASRSQGCSPCGDAEGCGHNPYPLSPCDSCDPVLFRLGDDLWVEEEKGLELLKSVR